MKYDLAMAFLLIATAEDRLGRNIFILVLSNN